MKKLSIIIPVYGVEAYIQQCIGSLLIPNRDDIELIVVNDGTPDNSMEIIRQCFNDPRIRIVEQSNGGLSSARNRGLQEATGEYVWFFDSDDWAESSLIPELIDSLKGEDAIAMTAHFRNYEETGQEKIFRRDLHSNDGLDYCRQDFYHPAPFYIYRRSRLQSLNIQFKEGILHEDSLFTPTTLPLMGTITCFQQPLYHYRQRAGSITKTYTSKRIQDLLFITHELTDFAQEHIPKSHRKAWEQCVVNIANGLLMANQQLKDKQTTNNVKKQVDGNWELIRYFTHASNFNNRCLGYLAMLLGGHLVTAYRLLYHLRYRS